MQVYLLERKRYFGKVVNGNEKEKGIKNTKWKMKKNSRNVEGRPLNMISNSGTY